MLLLLLLLSFLCWYETVNVKTLLFISLILTWPWQSLISRYRYSPDFAPWVSLEHTVTWKGQKQDWLSEKEPARKCCYKHIVWASGLSSSEKLPKKKKKEKKKIRWRNGFTSNSLGSCGSRRYSFYIYPLPLGWNPQETSLNPFIEWNVFRNLL